MVYRLMLELGDIGGCGDLKVKEIIELDKKIFELIL